MEIDVETADTVEFSDVFTNNSGSLVEVNLQQAFTPSELSYVAHSATSGAVTTDSDLVDWTVALAAGQSATLDLYLSVDPCNWTDSIVDRVWIDGSEQRDVTLHKWLHDLYIGSSYEAQVFAGQPASFELQYGNNGGYENSVDIRCDFAPDAPFSEATPTPDFVGPGGLEATWTVGDLANASSGSIGVAIEVEPDLPPGTPIATSCVIHDHTAASAGATLIEMTTGVTTVWDSYVNLEPWFPDITIALEMGDTITVDEELHNRSNTPIEVVLSQSFEPSSLSLIDVSVSNGTVNQDDGLNDWVVQIGYGETVTLAAIFSVRECVWTDTIISALLSEGDELRTVHVEKTEPILWIDAAYDPAAVAGQSAALDLVYGNDGGYENNVSIWCAFPTEAIFESSSPAPDFVGPNGLSANWSVGDLAHADEGLIAMKVEVADGLPFGFQISIACSIHNHVDDIVEDILINLETIDPLAIFEDGFESGDTSEWSDSIGFDDHRNNAARATLVDVPSVTNGDIEIADDVDWFQMVLSGGTEYVFETSLGTLPDSVLSIYDADGNTLLVQDDDSGSGFASRIEWIPPALGRYFIEVKRFDSGDIGTYSLSVGPN